MKPATEFYLKAQECIIDAGYQWEIDNCKLFHIESMDADTFALQYTFAVMSSTGLNNKVVQKMYDKFIEAVRCGNRRPFDTIPNRRMRDAIVRGWFDPAGTLKKIQMMKTDEERIAYIGTLRQMGPKSSLHFARNIGIDCVKPDRHMIRLAQKFGYATPLEMCKDIQSETNERLGVIDVILWRYCNLVGCRG